MSGTEQATNNEHRRGISLVAILVIYTLGAITAGTLLVSDWIDRADHGQDVPVVLVLSLASAVLQLVSVIALWNWRKWGLYLIGLLVAVGLALDIAHETPALLVSLKIVLAGALAFIVVPYWERMPD